MQERFTYEREKGSQDLRISSLECRIETLEQMTKFYNDLINLKQQDRNNDFMLQFQGTIDQINTKLIALEKKISIFTETNQKKVDSLFQRVQSIQNKFDNEIQHKPIEDKLAEIDSMMNKNELIIDNIIQDKLSIINYQNESKMKEILSLIEDLNKSTEENEFEVNELKNSIRNIQNENVEVIKVINIHNEKINQIDFIYEQITNLKNQYSVMKKMFNENEVEEENFINNYLSGDGAYEKKL